MIVETDNKKWILPLMVKFPGEHVGDVFKQTQCFYRVIGLQRPRKGNFYLANKSFTLTIHGDLTEPREAGEDDYITCLAAYDMGERALVIQPSYDPPGPGCNIVMLLPAILEKLNSR
jgi:hypothetical protein